MAILFDDNAKPNPTVESQVEQFLDTVNTIEAKLDMPIVIFQDGGKGSYYIKCSIAAGDASKLCDLSAKLDITNAKSYRANRDLLLKHETYKKMVSDSAEGREFNDIIVEYNIQYMPTSPLKVWGGQHRISAIQSGGQKKNRYHGFRIYFCLTKTQRTELALISNTNISVSNDTFDRMVEETIFGDKLRDWCQKVGFLNASEDFPDTASRSEKITVKRARSFIVNFYLGKAKGNELPADKLDKNVYEPYLPTTGVTIDKEYENTMKANDILSDKALLEAGKHFLALHKAQYQAVTTKSTKIKNSKAYRNKAFVESVLAGWSYIAGLLQEHPDRINNHYKLPIVTNKIPDPLNAEEMSKFKHDKDLATYRGLGTRSALKDRQRVAQLFLAKSCGEDVALTTALMSKAVSQTIGLLALSQGYSK